MSRPYKKPDLKAPRYFEKKKELPMAHIHYLFQSQYPEHEHVNLDTFTEIIEKFNTALWKTAVYTRDGVDLPENLGTIFVGSCWAPKKANVDYGKSNKYGMLVTHHNLATDGKVAKIFYTNYQKRYVFRNRAFWQFEGTRMFTRTLKEVYPERYQTYVQIDPNILVNKIYHKQVNKDRMLRKENALMHLYNEFDMD